MVKELVRNIANGRCVCTAAPRSAPDDVDTVASSFDHICPMVPGLPDADVPLLTSRRNSTSRDQTLPPLRAGVRTSLPGAARVSGSQQGSIQRQQQQLDMCCQARRRASRDGSTATDVRARDRTASDVRARQNSLETQDWNTSRQFYGYPAEVHLSAMDDVQGWPTTSPSLPLTGPYQGIVVLCDSSQRTVSHPDTGQMAPLREERGQTSTDYDSWHGNLPGFRPPDIQTGGIGRLEEEDLDEPAVMDVFSSADTDTPAWCDDSLLGRRFHSNPNP